MAFSAIFKVMVWTYTTVLILACFASLVVASFCPEKQYLNARLQKCMNCTKCSANMVVLRPCEIHRDTHCAPLSELLKTMDSGNPHRHKHQQHHHQNQKTTLPQQPQREDGGDIVWRFDDEVRGSSRDRADEPKVAASEVSSDAPFSRTETLVWDWQAIALTCAVFSCILFFLVIAFYSLHQARQWRRLKDNFEADVEELCARLSLMAASSSENDLLKEAGLSPTSPQDASNYLNNRCVYLEQLLSERKEGDKVGTLPRGNVYIEESNSK